MTKKSLSFVVMLLFLAYGSLFAADDFEQEFQKIAAAVSSLTTFSASVDLSFAGKFVETRPNFPRNATLYVATDGKKEECHRELEVTLDTSTGHYGINFVMQGKVAYMNVQAPGKEPIAYFVDTANPEKEKGQQMFSGLVVTTEARMKATKQNKLGDVLGVLQTKADVTLKEPGFIQLKDKRKEMDLDLYYDVKTHLPQKVIIYNRKNEGQLTVKINEWVLEGVSSTLPLPKESFKPFEMAALSKLMVVLPKPKELLEKSQDVTLAKGPEAPEKDDELAGEKPSFTKKTFKPSEKYINRRVRKEMQSAVKEMREVMEVLQDKEFQRSLRKAGSALKRLEGHLQKLEELDE